MKFLGLTEICVSNSDEALKLFAFGQTTKLNYNSSRRDKAQVIPFRDSKLTRLCQNFLVGQGKACMIVNISPCASSFDETLRVLQFRAIAKQVTQPNKHKYVSGQCFLLSIQIVPFVGDLCFANNSDNPTTSAHLDKKYLVSQLEEKNKEYEEKCKECMDIDKMLTEAGQIHQKNRAEINEMKVAIERLS
uniref:Kinesin motor domain-containing protein n=1 Tax=Romanomermis culicivorax TaxID=13658 RepID=A0A915HKQ0_ROMCU